MSNVDDGFADDEGVLSRPSPSAVRAESPRSTAIRTYDGGLSDQAAVASLNDFVVGGSNAVLLAATPLIALASRLQSTVNLPDVAGLREHAVQEVKAFDE